MLFRSPHGGDNEQRNGQRQVARRGGASEGAGGPRPSLALVSEVPGTDPGAAAAHGSPQGLFPGPWHTGSGTGGRFQGCEEIF